VTTRRAGPTDVELARTFWEGLVEEATYTPYPPAPFVPSLLADHLALVAEQGNEPVGIVYANVGSPGFGFVFGLYVVPAARRRGVATALVRDIAAALKEDGRDHVVLSVDTENAAGRALTARLGFVDSARTMRADVGGLLARLMRPAGRSFGSIHIQTDDVSAVERAVREFVPRLPGRSRGSIVAPPRHGWVAVYDDVCDRDPRQLRGLAKELSGRTGAVVLALGVEEDAVVRLILLERGSVVDEYLSVPEYFGPMPPGDVIALAANPRVVARLTGADPAAVREVARQASSPADLAPPTELLAQVAAALQVEGGEHGWEDAPDIPGAHRIAR
jgi:ribosomal protein S18 acetylase RimI-like enzyme